MNKLSVRLGIFGAVPLSILQDKGIDFSSLKTYIALMSFQGTKDNCYPSRPEIASRAHLSVKEVWRATNDLVRLGWVRRKQRGRGMTNIYECLAWMEAAPIGDFEKGLLKSFQEVHAMVPPERTTMVPSILKDHLKDQKSETARSPLVAADRTPEDEEKVRLAASSLPWRK